MSELFRLARERVWQERTRRQRLKAKKDPKKVVIKPPKSEERERNLVQTEMTVIMWQSSPEFREFKDLFKTP